MKAGDTNFASRKAGSSTFIYAGQIIQKKDSRRIFSGIKKFKYYKIKCLIIITSLPI